MKNTAENITLPDFAVQIVYANGEVSEQTLAQFMAKTGKNGLILYFYPKDNTPGCTVQAIDFTENFDKLQQMGYTVLGVSRDSVKSHQNFITKQQLNIALASDGDEALCQHFDVIKEKMMYGKAHLGVVRSTFVFDQTGAMIGSFRNVKAKEHLENLLDFLNNLA